MVQVFLTGLPNSRAGQGVSANQEKEYLSYLESIRRVFQMWENQASEFSMHWKICLTCLKGE